MNKLTRGLAGVVLAGASVLGLAGKSEAGIIRVSNMTSNGNVGVSTLYAKNIEGATNGYDTAYDSSFIAPPQTNALEIYSQVGSDKLSTDARPIDTSGWDFDLAVKGSVSGIDNYLRYKITDTTDLTDKTLKMYDKANPSAQYELLMDGAYHNINLSNLTFSNGEYAHWRLDIGPIPEPTSLALLAAGGTAAFGVRRRDKFSLDRKSAKIKAGRK